MLEKNRNTKQDISIVRLEEKVDNHTKSINCLTEKVNNLIGNHFPALCKEIGGLKATQKFLAGILIAIFLSLITLFIK